MMQSGFNLLASVALTLGLILGAASEDADAGEREATSRTVRAVVELFTSQGCSSCPKADAILANLARDPSLVALSYHVDYWDYIGWADPLASRANTDRQRAYAKAFGTGSIYTPQAVVNGARDVVGSRAGDISTAVDETRLTKIPEAPWISLSLRGDRLHVTADGKAEGRPLVLMLVTFDEETRTEVHRGENRGHTLVSANPVRDWRILGMWDGKRLDVDLPLSALEAAGKGKGGCAAILQSVTEGGAPGPILAAVALDF
ncbi:MAG: DUF1223 domain-containing protein [Rhizobiaceae bacterium]|nr:DUF1223 domain-containing protein [Rhizobiaceae bacterium]